MAEGRRKGAERRESEPDPAPRRSAKRRSSRLPRLVYWSLVLGLWLVIAAAGTMVWVTINLPPIQSLEIPRRPPQIEIVGLDGKPLATRGEMHGATVTLKDLPPYLPRAFIAIEDRRFYSHYGVDPIGLVRATAANVLRRGLSQGGSTITQQLAKNLFLTQERTLWRKMQEVVLALWLERRFSKTEILELYLNRVYFGSGAYGVEAAAQRYFGKPAREVKVAEAAMLARVEKDLVVETSIDPTLQAAGEKALTDELALKGQKLDVAQGALVAITPEGAVRAMVGGRNYAESQFNRAVAAKRQPGSAFKPFVYLTALERGLTPETVREDKPVALKGWKPENYSREYHGPVTLTQALALSLNTVAVRLTLEVVPRAVAKTAYRLGMASKLDANPALALGTSEVSLIELTCAYAPFANGGEAIAPHVVERVRTHGGKVLYVRAPQNLGRIVEPRHVAMMNAMMRETLLIGTAQKAQLPGWQAAGKTGTSQDFRDAWFVGYTAHLVTGVWLGNDDSSPTRKATGGGLPVDIWSRFMRVAHQGVPVANLPGQSGPTFALFGPSATGAGATGATGAPRPPASIGDMRSQDAPPPQRPNNSLDGWLLDLFGGRR